jgi:hypothetical protein
MCFMPNPVLSGVSICETYFVVVVGPFSLQIARDGTAWTSLKIALKDEVLSTKNAFDVAHTTLVGGFDRKRR